MQLQTMFIKMWSVLGGGKGGQIDYHCVEFKQAQT